MFAIDCWTCMLGSRPNKEGCFKTTCWSKTFWNIHKWLVCVLSSVLLCVVKARGSYPRHNLSQTTFPDKTNYRLTIHHLICLSLPLTHKNRYDIDCWWHSSVWLCLQLSVCLSHSQAVQSLRGLVSSPSSYALKHMDVFNPMPHFSHNAPLSSNGSLSSPHLRQQQVHTAAFK